jgi:hypothetical protein
MTAGMSERADDAVTAQPAGASEPGERRRDFRHGRDVQAGICGTKLPGHALASAAGIGWS